MSKMIRIINHNSFLNVTKYSLNIVNAQTTSNKRCKKSCSPYMSRMFFICDLVLQKLSRYRKLIISLYQWWLYRTVYSNLLLISNENYTWENKWQMKLCDEWGQIISSSSHWLRNKVDSSFYIAIYILLPT